MKNSFKKAYAMIMSVVIALQFSCINDVYAASEKNDTVYGDVNNDGEINVLDMVLLKSFICSGDNKSINTTAADLDGDVDIGNKDAAELSWFLLNQISAFSNECSVDSDGDGLCDYIEKEIFSTDPLKPDSDGDGLSDYEEIYYTDTDPLKKYSDEQDIADDLKDPDNDMLTNIQEMQYNSDPLLNDTDEDKINDYDEINKYKTDPGKYDTDEDGISDYAEINMGLDPLSTQTDGVNDCEHVFEQNIDKADVLLSKINTEDNKYLMSLKIKAAGDVSETLDVRKSRNSDYINNCCMYGEPAELSYNPELTIEQVEVCFEIKDSDPDKYCIFKYGKNGNMLLPVETQYNGNILSYTDTEFGTYCLIDTQMWVNNILAPDLSSDSQVRTNINNVGNNEDSSNKELGDKTDIYFVLFQRNGDSTLKKGVADAAKAILNYYTNKDIRIYFTDYKGTILTSVEAGHNYVDRDIMINYANPAYSCDIVSYLTDRLSGISGSIEAKYDPDYSLVGAIKELGKKKDEAIDSVYEIASSEENRDRDKYCYVCDMNFEPYDGGDYFWINSLKDDYDVDFTFACNKKNPCTASYRWLSDDELEHTWETSENLTNMIKYKFIHDSSPEAYLYFSDTFSNLKLDTQISPDWIKAAKGELTDKEIADLKLPDSDKDGLYDYEEIDMKYFDIDKETGKIIFPVFSDVMMANGLNIFKTKIKSLENNESMTEQQILDMPVIPLKSHPNRVDSDLDGITDADEYTNQTSDTRYDYLDPLSKDTIETLYPELSDNRKYNKASNPVYLDIDDNKVTFKVKYKTSGDWDDKSNIINPETSEKYTNGEIFLKSIKDKWTNTFKSSKYDFYPGLKISTDVKFSKASLFEKNIDFTINDNAINNSESKYDTDWEANNIKIIRVSTLYDDLSGVSERDRFAAPAHEFGHILGLADLYGYSSKKSRYRSLQRILINIPAGNSNEIWYNEEGDNVDGDLMFSYGRVSANNIEMVLQAYCENTMQYYNHQTKHNISISKAIKEYPDVNVYLDRFTGKFVNYDPDSNKISDLQEKDSSGAVYTGDTTAYAIWLDKNYGIKVTDAQIRKLYNL